MSSDWDLTTGESDSDSDLGSNFSEWSNVSVTVNGSGDEGDEGTTATPSLLDGDILENEPGQAEPERPAEPSAEYLRAESRFPALEEHVPSPHTTSAPAQEDDLVNVDWTLARKRLRLIEQDRKVIDRGLELPPLVPSKPTEGKEQGDRNLLAELTMPSMSSVPPPLPPFIPPSVSSFSTPAIPANVLESPLCPPQSLGITTAANQAINPNDSSPVPQQPSSTPIYQHHRYQARSSPFYPGRPHWTSESRSPLTGGEPGFRVISSNNQPAEPVSAAAPGKKCVVCMHEKDPRKDYPSRPLSEACIILHKGPNTCIECVKKTVETSLWIRPLNQIDCPERCTGRLSYESIIEYASPEQRARCEKMMLLSVLKKDKDFVWCSARCGSGQLHEGGVDQPIVSCTSCGKQTCFYHKTAWHTGITCDEIDIAAKQQREEEDIYTSDDITRAQKTGSAPARALEELRTENVINRTTKPCPSCGGRIEKAGGCAHMTCFNCLYSFCWECSANYDEILRTDNTAHKETCRFHTQNLSRTRA